MNKGPDQLSFDELAEGLTSPDVQTRVSCAIFLQKYKSEEAARTILDAARLESNPAVVWAFMTAMRFMPDDLVGMSLTHFAIKEKSGLAAYYALQALTSIPSHMDRDALRAALPEFSPLLKLVAIKCLLPDYAEDATVRRVLTDLEDVLQQDPLLAGRSPSPDALESYPRPEQALGLLNDVKDQIAPT